MELYVLNTLIDHEANQFNNFIKFDDYKLVNDAFNNLNHKLTKYHN